MKVLLDMNMSPRLVELLTGPHCEVIHWATVGTADDPDVEIMAHAAAHRYRILTNDLDFGIFLAATNATQPSVVQVRLDDLNPVVIFAQIATVLNELRPELEAGALVTIDSKKTRTRLLPVGPKR